MEKNAEKIEIKLEEEEIIPLVEIKGIKFTILASRLK